MQLDTRERTTEPKPKANELRTYRVSSSFPSLKYQRGDAGLKRRSDAVQKPAHTMNLNGLGEGRVHSRTGLFS